MKLKIVLVVLSLIQSIHLAAQNFERLTVSDFQATQLWKLAQLYGCARYFSPNPYVDNLDWYAFLEKNIRDVLPMTSRVQADSLLLARFSPLLPDLQFTDAPAADSSPAVCPFYIKATTLNTGFQKSATSSRVIRMQENVLQLPQKHTVRLSSDLHACYRVATEKLLEESDELKQLKKSLEYKWTKDFYLSPYYRLTNAIISGAYIQHFYAYYAEDGLDGTWKEFMKSYLKQVAACASYPEYLTVSYAHYGHVKDGHLYVMNGYSKPGSMLGKFQPIYYPQIEAGVTREGKIYVSSCAPDNGIRTGEEIVSVNGKDIHGLIAEKMKYASAATEADRKGKVLDLFLFQSFQKDSVLRLEVRGTDGQLRETSVSIRKGDNYITDGKEDFISQVKEGIWKINPCLEKGAGYKEFSQYIHEFERAKGIIIDLRGYPDASILPILSHFIDKPALVGQILTPTFYLPDHQKVDYQITAESKWGIHPALEPYQKSWEYEQPVPVRIKRPVYFLTNRKALSFCETVIELIKYYKIGTIIGEPTSGTNGDAVILRNPSIGFIFTGYKFLNHDGSRHHGIGVQPDIECQPLLEDVQKGRDTLVEEACRLILNSGKE